MQPSTGPALMSALLMALLIVAPARAVAQDTAIYNELDLIHPVYARSGMVATQEVTATRIGLEVLQEGGNAVDAAATVAFALAVSLPRAGNIGGGGFMIVHDAASGDTVAIDYREKAGGNAFRDMFLDEAGEADAEKSATAASRWACPAPWPAWRWRWSVTVRSASPRRWSRPSSSPSRASG